MVTDPEVSMMTRENKISSRQLMLIFITVISSPAIRLFPSYAAEQAQQSGWLSPLAALLPGLLLVFLLKRLFQAYPDKSLADVFQDVFGKAAAHVLLIVYAVYILLLAGLYLRYFYERLMTTIYPLIGPLVFVFTTLLLLAFVLRGGLTVLARMNEIIVILILAVLAMTIGLLLPTVRLDYVTPVITYDWPGIFKGSIASVGTFCYLFALFFIGDQVKQKERIFSLGWKAMALLTVLSMLINFVCIGNIGYHLVERMPLPFVVTIRQIAFLDIIEKMESLVVTVWIFSDLILVGIFSYLLLRLVKWLSKIPDEKPLIKPVLILVGLCASMLATNRYEMGILSKKIFLPVNILLFIFIPILLFLTAKIRKKI